MNIRQFISFLVFCFQVLPETVVNFIKKNIFHFISLSVKIMRMFVTQSFLLCCRWFWRVLGVDPFFFQFFDISVKYCFISFLCLNCCELKFLIRETNKAIIIYVRVCLKRDSSSCQTCVGLTYIYTFNEKSIFEHHTMLAYFNTDVPF